MAVPAVVDLDESTRRPGRPRDTRVDKAVADAVIEILSEHGLAGLTVDRVAAHAGVGKATIYRRWPSKEDLVKAVMEDFHSDFPDPDTGSLRGDLLALTTHVAEFLGNDKFRSCVSQMLAAAQCDPTWSEKTQQFCDEKRRASRRILRRAKRRGELRSDLDEEAVLDMVVSPIFFRILVSGGPVDRKFAAKYVDALVRGLVDA